jgi:hypothetical protein
MSLPARTPARGRPPGTRARPVRRAAQRPPTGPPRLGAPRRRTPPPRPRQRGGPPARPASPTLAPWIATQSTNVARHAAALRPFRLDEFGVGDAAPSRGHVQAANGLIGPLRARLLRVAGQVSEAAAAAQRNPTRTRLNRLTTLKARAHTWVRAIEQIWDFYFELFGQRQSVYGDWLLACDRIALDCYRVSFGNLGLARSIPAPAPFSYMRTGFSPATFRRTLPLRRLGRQPNPFPLVQLPYHRLVNVWTLGAVLHEVSHNLQNDLGLARRIPEAIGAALRQAGLGETVAAVWTRWNREAFADLSGLMLGGPAIVGSLMDVVGREPAVVVAYSPRGPHPTPWLRTLLSCELLRRMGFPREAEGYRRAWLQLYPDPSRGSIPPAVVRTHPQAIRIVVDTVCFRRYRELGNRSLAQVIRFEPKEQRMIEEAARRLAAGVDPGVIPERFLIGAARVAFERRYARPGTVTRNFYGALARR